MENYDMVLVILSHLIVNFIENFQDFLQIIVEKLDKDMAHQNLLTLEVLVALTHTKF